MSSTQSYNRFTDEKYKNWLKTTESLYILRSRIQNFIEKETETYHNSLRNKPKLNRQNCALRCKRANEHNCQLCEYWKKEIFANHEKGKNIHWANCQPHLWPTDKWEVAKAHMPRGQIKHRSFEQFDISAILNLIGSCKHFENIPAHCVNKVINVRNSVMHSPDLKVSNEDMKKHHKTLLQLAEKLVPHVPEMKDLEKEITQFYNILDKNFNQSLCEVDGQQQDLQAIKNLQKVLDREQQAMKDRIEDIISRFEGNQDENIKEKSQDMKSLLDFLDQNKDLMETLGPEVNKLKEMQARVDQHEEQISNLTGRVDQLEKVTHATDSVFPGNPLKYKNHLYEHCRAKKWPEDKFPVFTEDQEAQGYRGKVTVNGQSFTGTRVFNDKKAAHQEVAYIALEQLKLQVQNTDEPSSSYPEASSSSSSGSTFFGKVSVDLNREITSDKCSSKEEAAEAAYKVLWESFCNSASVEGQTYKSVTMEYFNTNGFPKPIEDFNDSATICKLKLVGSFTFCDKDGSTKKKQAEQQAAKVALDQLSSILCCPPISDTEENFKGVLKECLDQLGHKNPVYDTAKKAKISEEPMTTDMSSDMVTSTVSISQAEVKDLSESESISTSAQESVNVPVNVQPDPPDSSSSASERKKPRIDCPENFFSKVIVDLSREVASDRCSTKKEATEAAYKVLWESFRISAPAEGQTYRTGIMEYFNTHDLQKPTEEFVDDENTTICKLKLIGPFTFCDKDGSTKKKQAEQQAAKVALHQLSWILSCPQLSDTEKNFKGVLKERLDQLSIKNPVYETEEYKAETSEEPVTSGMSPKLSNCISQLAVKDLSESESISTSAQPSSCQESVRVPVHVQPDPPDSSSPASQRKKPRIECPENFFSKVIVDLSREVASNRCSTKEEATEAAYKALWESFRISAPAEGQTYRTGIMEYFNTHDLEKPTEEFVDDENTTICKLKLIGPFTFYDNDGSTRKKQAEQQAAKVALHQLSWILSCPQLSDTEKNFKGVLKERLDQLSIKNPVYETEEYKAETSEEPVTSVSVSQEEVKDHSESESISTSAQLPSDQESVHVPVTVRPDPPDSSSPASQRKKPRIDCPEINELFNVYNLKPPHVNVENMKCDQNVKCTVTVNLEKYTFANKQGYDTKREAIRKAYLLFGRAMEILDPNSDEKMCSAQVNQHFSQRSLTLPQADVEGSAKSFYCSLKNITCDAKYDGQGSSEDQAKLHALQKALSSLSPLFGYPSLRRADSPEEVQNQLSTMLKAAGQRDPVIDLKSEERACIQLSFSDYALKCTCQSNKKAARNHLCERILGLLGVKTDNNASLRNSVDEWFKKQNLSQPVFEDTEEALGVKATFSVPLTCCSPGWEDSWETAKSKLLQELKLRFRFLDDKNN